MKGILTHIQFLLASHDCVILPGFGAFVAQSQPAHVHHDIIESPKRTIGFNAELSHNDGLLAGSIARREAISYEAALRMVDSQVDMIKAVIDLTGEYTLPRIGRFTKSKSGKILFHPQTENNIADIRFYGLIPVNVTPTAGASLTEEERQPANVLRAVGKAVKWAAAIIVIFMIGIAIATPVIFNKEVHYQASVVSSEIIQDKDPETPIVEQTIVERPQPDEETPETDSSVWQITLPHEDEATPTAILSESTEPATTHTAEPQTQTRRMDLDDTYFLIVASLESKEKALNYIRRHADEQLQLLECDGRHRIFAASGSSSEALLKYQADKDFSTKHPDAWIYKKQ